MKSVIQRNENVTSDLTGEIDMAEHKHGEMDITVQEKTFEKFVKVSAWTCVVVILTLIFMALVNA